MSSYFFKALAVCFFALLLILGYEAAYPYIPTLKNFESAHFWTAYSKVTADSTAIDSTAFLEDLNNFEHDSTTADSTVSDSLFTDIIKLSAEDSMVLAELENYSGIEHLSEFFQKLQELRQGNRKRVRIAYFGDSTTEGDLVVGDLRAMLQRIFGGRGVGFVSVAPQAAKGRRTILHKYSSNWSVVSYFRQFKNPEFPFGIGGDYGIPSSTNPNEAYTLSFQSSWGNFNNVYLFYGKGKSEQFPNLLINKGEKDSVLLQLDGKSTLNSLPLNASNTQKIELSFNFSEPFPIYGLSFESETGIIVDNMAKRSDSGSNFGRINREILRSFNDFLGSYDLVILHYGANVLSDRILDYSHYEQILSSTVRHFKESMDNIPVLIIGTSDRVSKIEGSEQTTPAVFGLLKAQKRAAARTKSPFIDLFKEMGGEGSMLRWVNSNPPKAAPDFVHFSGNGAKEIAKIVFDYLASGYAAVSGENFKISKPGLMKTVLDEHNKSSTSK